MNSFKSTLKAAIALGIGIACVMPASAAPPTGASAKIKFEQVGSNVVATLSGTLDTSGFTQSPSYGDPGIFGLLKGKNGVGIFGSSYVELSGWNLQYGGGAPIANFGSSSFTHLADSSTGAFTFAIWADNPGSALAVNSAYVSGAQMNASSTWNNKSLSGLGIQNGVYRWTYGNAGEHEIKMAVGVPEPGEWAAMGILGAGLTGLVIRKRRRTA